MSFVRGLFRFFSILTFAFLVCIAVAAVMEDYGVARQWIAYFFIFATLGAYALIGLLSRTSSLSEYFIASRSVPAVFNGMATAADWMSAASFLGVAGALYYNGFDALAFLVGWTGGFVLIALLIAPYLRKFDFYTVGDFLAARYAGHDEGKVVRLICIGVTVSISFVYVVAQIYAVGLISSRFTGVEFGIGVFFGLTGVLVCSFLEGMRAVTWTEVAQYLVMIVAMVVTVVTLFAHVHNKATLTANKGEGFSVAAFIQAQEKHLQEDPAEQEVRNIYAKEVSRFQLLIDDLPSSWAEGYEARRKNLEMARYDGSSFRVIKQAEQVLASFPKTPDKAKQLWAQQQQMLLEKVQSIAPHYQVPSHPQGLMGKGSAINFLAIAFTLMCGTVALPHLVVRFFTTPNASQTRWAVVYALGFILVLYLAAPLLASLAKVVVYQDLVGLSYADVPNWVAAWSRVSPGLVTLQDINQDGIVQFAEVGIHPDVLVLITPEIAGLPFFLSGLIAAGGLAAALSTADGLLLAIANSLSHDLYFRLIDKQATAQKRVTMSKIALLCVALAAAWVTSLQPGHIVDVVGAAFVLAGSALFVPLVAGVFWERATQKGAVWSMGVGFVCGVLYLVVANAGLMAYLQLVPLSFYGLSPLGAGLITMPMSAIAMVIASLLDQNAPDMSAFLTILRQPERDNVN